jgi:hypothetical protein
MQICVHQFVSRNTRFTTMDLKPATIQMTRPAKAGIQAPGLGTGFRRCDGAIAGSTRIGCSCIRTEKSLEGCRKTLGLIMVKIVAAIGNRDFAQIPKTAFCRIIHVITQPHGTPPVLPAVLILKSG